MPKPLHKICGRPMLSWILDACYQAGCDNVVVVVGHEKQQVIDAFSSDKRITWVEQTEQLGTGHAVMMCREELGKHGQTGDVFILAGDGPLIRPEVLAKLKEAHHNQQASASMATAVLDDPTGYGRILRDSTGEFLDIIEQADASPQQLLIREVFPSYYCCRRPDLLWALGKLTNTNKKGEYYLTDIYGHLRRDGRKVVAVQAVGADDVLSVNTRQQQADVDTIMQQRIQKMHRDNGVTIVSSSGTYIEAGANIGIDTVIMPFSFIGADAVIGKGCVIGPNATVTSKTHIADGKRV
jgi:bifunctional UDP-N-acetylglucosamine pyrophosphorylase/glucosamine-1-phosphate N-acetyltransferase